MNVLDGTRPRTAELGIAASAVLIGAGALLLGLQVDGNGRLSGTGFAPFAIGALLALAATLVRYGGGARLPRDLPAAAAAAFSFLALATLLSGVLAPGGPWMFAQVLLLFFLVARRGPGRGERWLGAGALTCLGLFLLFRLWITYQGSEYRWQVLSIGIPVLSWIPLPLLEPIQRVSLGSFTPHELGFPPAGLDFAVTMTAWAGGFTLCAAGLLVCQAAAREHENDRIDALICTLPPALAALVEKLLPEEEWEALGLHGLGDRQLAKRIEALVAERLQRQREFQSALEASQLLAATNPGGFTGSIHQALVRYAPATREVEDEARGVPR